MNALAELASHGKEYKFEKALYLEIPLWGSLAHTGAHHTNILQFASEKIRNYDMEINNCLANLACTSCSFTLELNLRLKK